MDFDDKLGRNGRSPGDDFLSESFSFATPLNQCFIGETVDHQLISIFGNDF